jgi:hypothetical protein
VFIPILGALLACAVLDISVLYWISVGPPLGKGESFFPELVLVGATGLVAGVVSIVSPARARIAIPSLLLVFDWHTGFQLSFSHIWPVILSAFDVLVPVLLVISLLGKWYGELGPGAVVWRYLRPLGLFGIAAAWGLALGLVRAVDQQALLMNMKALILYPCVVLIMVWTIKTWRQLYGAIGILLLLVTERAVVGLQHQSVTSVTTILANGRMVSRINGDFASVNQYAFYLMSGVLVALGVIAAGRSHHVRLLLVVPLVTMVIALLLTFSRGAWLGCGVGVLTLIVLLQAKRALYLLGCIFLLYWAVTIIQPGAATLVSERANSTNELSITQRQDWLQLGLGVVERYPLGAGWGAAFTPTASGPEPDHFWFTDWPWYHDDYLQLATEIGIPGLGVFIWLWFFILRSGIRACTSLRGSPQFGLITGLLAALVGMLVQASTDQFFWRTDIGPHIWILAGLLLAAVSLQRSETGGVRNGVGA